MDVLLYAVPFFFLLIAVELLADRWRGVSNYRVDATNSISTGVRSTTTGLLTKGVGLGPTGSEPVPQIRGAVGRASAVVCRAAVLRLHRAGQLFDES